MEGEGVGRISPLERLPVTGPGHREPDGDDGKRKRKRTPKPKADPVPEAGDVVPEAEDEDAPAKGTQLDIRA